jgi:hypothetical protein
MFADLQPKSPILNPYIYDSTEDLIARLSEFVIDPAEQVNMGYSGLLVTTMSNEYRIEPAGTQFAVIDAGGERVNTYPTEEAAKKEIERCKKEDAMYKTAKRLVDAAMTAHAEMFGISRETARYWIRSAAETKE